MTSKQTQERDKEFKQELYEGLGVREYWLFDPRGEWIEERLRGYRLVGEGYEPIRDGRSEPLGLRVQVEGEVLGFYREETGEKLLVPEELAQELGRVARELEQERQARGQAEEREQQERRARQEAERRAGRLAEYLRTQGIDPDSL